jgi:hypothetical protein
LRKEFTFGNVTVKPGEIGFGSIAGTELKDSSVVSLPIIVSNGIDNGPKFFVSGAVHGAELIGAEVVRRVMREEVNPKKLRGMVVGTPVSNPLGFQFGERANPHDFGFPNFDEPGNPDGSISDRIGAIVWKEVTSKMDLRVDIHGNYSPCTAFCLLSLHDPRKKDMNDKMAQATGLTIVYSPPTGTLEGMNGKYDISYKPPNSVSLELIDAGRVTDISTDLGTRAVLNVMKLWKMIDGPIEKQPKEYIWGGSRVENGGTLRANRGGIIHFTRIPGELISKGEVVAKIYNPYGDMVEETKFPFDGYIRAYAGGRHQAVNTGSTIAYITHEK